MIGGSYVFYTSPPSSTSSSEHSEVAGLFRTLVTEVDAFRSQLSLMTGPGPKPSVINHVWLWITQWKPHSRVYFAVRIWGVNYCCASQPIRHTAVATHVIT